MSANDKQVGGDHYRKVPGEQHWDRIYRLYGRGYFVGCATKYAERYYEKNGKEDLEKAVHFLQKLIELEYPEKPKPPSIVDVFMGQVVSNRNSDLNHWRTFKAFESSAPQYLHDQDFLCEGGSGNGSNLYRCRNCRALLWATGLEEAAKTHTRACHLPAPLAPKSDGS